MRFGKEGDDDFIDAVLVWRGRPRPRLVGSRRLCICLLLCILAGEGARAIWFDQFAECGAAGIETVL